MLGDRSKTLIGRLGTALMADDVGFFRAACAYRVFDSYAFVAASTIDNVDFSREAACAFHVFQFMQTILPLHT